MYTHKQQILHQKFELAQQNKIQKQIASIEKLSYALQESAEKDVDMSDWIITLNQL